jgi:hypothetical protein
MVSNDDNTIEDYLSPPYNIGRMMLCVYIISFVNNNTCKNNKFFVDSKYLVNICSNLQTNLR